MSAKILQFGRGHTVNQIVADAVGMREDLDEIMFVAIKKDGTVLTSWTEGDKVRMLGAGQLLEKDLIGVICDEPRELCES